MTGTADHGGGPHHAEGEQQPRVTTIRKALSVGAAVVLLVSGESSPTATAGGARRFMQVVGMRLLVRHTAIHRGLIALAVTALVVGCARPVAQENQEPSPTVASTSSASVSATTSPSPEPSARPAWPAILTFDQGGGLIGPDAYNALFPPFTLLGDGRVVLLKAPVHFSSGPMFPDVRIRQLTDVGVMTVVETAITSGQFVADAAWDGMGTLGLYDAGTATFTLNTDGTPVTVSVYGLGAYLTDEPPPDLPADELKVHQALIQLFQQLSTIESWLPADAWSEPAWEPYRPDSIRLFARNADADVAEIDAPFDERPWPDEEGMDWNEYEHSDWGIYQCRMADSADADLWYGALSDADGLTRFIRDGHRYQVSIGLALPDETIECP
jgi:hypothetical protein